MATETRSTTISCVQTPSTSASELTAVNILTPDNHEKKVHSFNKSKHSDSSGVSSLKREGLAHSDPKIKATIFNQQFSDVFP
ncbi:hypothetical protein DPMN_018380 [Dreissena polymorpha]|uniref:Uncharacterized protein n=1 Tax=Dreissena polymorpha TaxID=45954 RepID=A0A9D4S6B6_DREPO|nr:hypothetical protein DPMN_018380 [Dreissena polymorpha]